MIIKVDEATLPAAAMIHAEAWKDSHAGFYDKPFVELHTPKRQRAYLQNEMQNGKRLYMLVKQAPVGIVSVKDDLIENLYVLPPEQRKGYGTELLQFAIKQCVGTPRLWILDNNEKAYALYCKHGFALTGVKHKLSETLSEVEMKLTPASQS